MKACCCAFKGINLEAAKPSGGLQEGLLPSFVPQTLLKAKRWKEHTHLINGLSVVMNNFSALDLQARDCWSHHSNRKGKSITNVQISCDLISDIRKAKHKSNGGKQRSSQIGWRTKENSQRGKAGIVLIIFQEQERQANTSQGHRVPTSM
ncbi:Protein Mono-Adp-Ribosyltransferase Tiparp [Manis pentadactyla]|nr:Protein Mono-Adp-Ribosyltransferase Tiparp [Manis pentadactyla]